MSGLVTDEMVKRVATAMLHRATEHDDLTAETIRAALEAALAGVESLLYDAYAALRETHLLCGLDENYPRSAEDAFERIGTILFPDA